MGEMYDTDYEMSFSESTSSSEEMEEEKTVDLLKGKKAETMADIIKVLKDKGGISVGNIIGVQRTFGVIEKSDLNDTMKHECFSTINLLICLSNMYLGCDLVEKNV